MIKITTILLIGLTLRLWGLNWDQGFHMHPDERMLIMIADKINFFDNLNPDFFNYGTLPLYLLKALAQITDFFLFTQFSNYDGLLYLGRFMSVIADVTVIYLISLISKLLFKRRQLILWPAFLYAVAFFPIQNTHFFIVDVYLNLFSTLLIYLLLTFLIKPSFKKVFLISLVSGALLATKLTAVIFFILVIAVFFIKEKDNFKQFILNSIYFLIFTVMFHFIFMPYAYLSFGKFIESSLLQSKMNSDPYIFPYTLQYVNTFPYLYYLKNIFIWGLGPVISALGILGLIRVIREIRKNRQDKLILVIFVIFYFIYFLAIGQSAVKFMRYMLPLYPFLAVMAGYGLYNIKFLKIIKIIIVIGIIIWTVFFLNIYSYPNTRIQATRWILDNIPIGSTLAIEHWDDRLPIFGNEKYNFVEMSLYEQPDDNLKWTSLKQRLAQADYIIIASNRLYVPLQKLADCSKYRSCYPQTAKYYDDLFNGRLGFKKTAEFTDYPTLGINIGSANWRMKIADDNADESFTVYDHPKIMIFKRI
ncbi:MAG: glycosyltransferase family 39 protein [Candidatus Roizmanbacteria bacterium]|nr:MAG: glycosyltransferase family 39 protein [Candidatus Roizmanbacteria bacterium]